MMHPRSFDSRTDSVNSVQVCGCLRFLRGWPIAAFLMLALFTPQNAAAQATIFVTTTQQGVTDPNNCSLQEAIYSAEFAVNSAIGATSPDTSYRTGCVKGTGKGDIIVLQNEIYQFNNFWDGDSHNPFGPTATPIINKKITIEGNVATLQWTGSGHSRLF